MKAFIAIALAALTAGKCDDSDEKAIPDCMRERIEQIKSEDVWNPAATVWRITTKDSKTLYFIPSHCCDFFSELYDTNCNLLCNPDGGITGKGNGNCPEYEEAKKELIWKDKRGE